jgi:sugar lactone lactonase YvrE
MLWSKGSRSRRAGATGVVRLAAIFVGALTLMMGSAVHPAGAATTTYAVGDVFVSVGNGAVQWRLPDGTLNATLSDGTGGYTTGSAFDKAGNLYVTNFSNSTVAKYDTHGALLGQFGSGYQTPESIVLDAAGNVYVGNINGFILKFDAAGNQLKQFNTGRVDWMDLAADQCTMYFDTEGGRVQRYNVCTDAALPDFSTNGGDYALRLLPDGGLLVADDTSIDRMDAAGNVIKSYNTPSAESGWFALNLDPDGTSFWSASFFTNDVVKFDLATGNVLKQFNSQAGTVFGLSVFGERTQAVGKSPCVTGGLLADKTVAKTLYDGGLKSVPLVKDPQKNGAVSKPVGNLLQPTDPVGNEVGCAISLADSK